MYYTYIFFCVASTCDHGDVRLYGGYTKSDGYAEVCINGQWTSICNNSQANITGIKFCRQLLGRENVGMSSHRYSTQHKSSFCNIRIYLL